MRVQSARRSDTAGRRTRPLARAHTAPPSRRALAPRCPRNEPGRPTGRPVKGNDLGQRFGGVLSAQSFQCLAKGREVCYNAFLRFGTWRSLVARTVRDREAAGSNPVVPTRVSAGQRGCTSGLFSFGVCVGPIRSVRPESCLRPRTRSWCLGSGRRVPRRSSR